LHRSHGDVARIDYADAYHRHVAAFDLIWFGVIMTIVMELGLIHPPVGLNLFVIKSIAPDIPLRDVIWGVLPFVALMIFAVVILCMFPGIATWLATAVMGG
jgi:C4-dicarboxylate transporter, DctM subunit